MKLTKARTAKTDANKNEVISLIPNHATDTTANPENNKLGGQAASSKDSPVLKSSPKLNAKSTVLVHQAASSNSTAVPLSSSKVDPKVTGAKKTSALLPRLQKPIWYQIQQLLQRFYLLQQKGTV
jgi:hypothetical protein